MSGQLTSVLFTDIVGSSEIASRLGNARWTELLTHHHAVVRDQLGRHGGTELDTAGDGFLASFNSPGDAVRCAREIIAWVRPIGVHVRAGVHIGECEVVDGKPVGIPVHVGSRVAAAARPNQVFVSSTVRELLAGSELGFIDEGTHTLRGIPGDWHLFSLAAGTPPRPSARIQVCGRFLVEIDGTQVGSRLPGRQGKVLFAYIVVNRQREIDRGELTEALWLEPPPDADGSLSALLSKVRRAVGADRLQGRHTIRLTLGGDAWIDLEAAAEALHRAESAQKQGDWKAAWGAARVPLHIGQRPFLPGEEAPWIDEVRRELEVRYLRSLEITASASLELGGSELDTAERSARTLIRRAPFMESGYRFLMRVYDRRDNPAEALRVYERLRTMLRDELGVSPSSATQQLHRGLLGPE
jgi:class 3 adenylate cyclase/DNA-binding SARP family transcriptional activator